MEEELNPPVLKGKKTKDKAISDLLNATDRIVREVNIANCPKVSEIDTTAISQHLPSTISQVVCKHLQEPGSDNESLRHIQWRAVANTTGLEDLNVWASPLVLGDVALPKSCFESKTRVSSHSANLEPATFRAALANIQVNELIDLFAAEIEFEYTSEEIEAGRRMSITESQLIEFKFPWETDIECSDSWFVKAVGLYLTPLLNGAGYNDEVQLWLGVQDRPRPKKEARGPKKQESSENESGLVEDQNGLMIGATVDGIGLVTNLAETVRIFPKVRKIKIKEFKIKPPATEGALWVKWIAEDVDSSDSLDKKTIKEGWETIAKLDGRGWFFESDTKLGVAATEEFEGFEPLTIGGTLMTERSVICIAVKSEFPQAYISEYTRLGQHLAMFPFEAWLRLHSAQKSPFYEEFNRDTSFSIRLLNGSRRHLSCQKFPSSLTAYESDDMDELIDILFNHGAKQRFVLADVDCADKLSKLIEEDQRETAMTHGKIRAKWHVGLVAASIEFSQAYRTSPLEQKFSHAVRLLQRDGVRVEEFTLEMDQNLHYLVSKQRTSIALQRLGLDASLEIIHRDLVQPDELTKDEVKRIAKAWICPSEEGRDHGKPAWSVVKAGYLVVTEYVIDILMSIKQNLHNQASRIVRVGSEMPGCGLTAALHLAAWECAIQPELKEYTVVFMHEVPQESEANFRKLLLHGPAIVFCDTNVALNEIHSSIRRDPKILFVEGMSVNESNSNEWWNVIIRTTWSKQSLTSLKNILVQFDFESHSTEDTEDALKTTMKEMDAEASSKFYVLPWVASRGKYIHVRRSIERQVADVKGNSVKSAVNSFALFTMVLSKDKLSTFACPAYFLVKSLPLMIVESRSKKKIARFVHSEVARAYLHRQFSPPYGDFDDFYPDRLEEFLTGEVQDFLETSDTETMKKIVREMFYKPLGDAPFTRFCQNLISGPFNKLIMDLIEKLSTNAGVPPCDRDMLLSRMHRRWGRMEDGIMFAKRAVKANNDLKAVNNLAQSYADAALVKSGPDRQKHCDEAMRIFKGLEAKANTKEKLESLNYQVLNFQNSFKSGIGTANQKGQKRKGARKKKLNLPMNEFL